MCTSTFQSECKLNKKRIFKGVQNININVIKEMNHYKSTLLFFNQTYENLRSNVIRNSRYMYGRQLHCVRYSKSFVVSEPSI